MKNKILFIVALLGMASLSLFCQKRQEGEMPFPTRGGLPGTAVGLAPLAPKELPKLVEEAKLTYAPEVPPLISRNQPAVLKVKLETTEQVGALMGDEKTGTRYLFWGFNGHTPGPFIRARQGDVLELTISNNPSSKMPHNIDLHAATGTGGGSAITTVAPGETKTVHLALLNAGLYIYHCAMPPVPEHIVNGMYGLILVEPPGGFPKVDREFYVLQSEFYTREPFGYSGLTHLDREKAAAEHPTYIVFNGKYGSLLGDGALRAKVGETVRIYFGVGGPNLASNFHVIGEIFDRVFFQGATSAPLENVQTTLVPPGGAAIVEFHLDVPGTYTLVDHAIFRTEKGAIGHLIVEGEENPIIYGEVTGKSSASSSGY